MEKFSAIYRQSTTLLMHFVSIKLISFNKMDVDQDNSIKPVFAINADRSSCSVVKTNRHLILFIACALQSTHFVNFS